MASSITAPLARPPPSSAPSASPLSRSQSRVRIRHPGYGDLPNNILLDLPTVDSAAPTDASATHAGLGLHHRTALTAGAIVANNAFRRAYFTHDQLGARPVVVPLDGILAPGDYWLQLRGEEPALASSVVSQVSDASVTTPGAWPEEGSSRRGQGGSSGTPDDEDAGAVQPGRETQGPSTAGVASMPSPPPPPPRPRPGPGRTPAVPMEHEPYPIVPSFGDWRFPHRELPTEWMAPHTLPAQPHMHQPTQAPRLHHCYLTGLRMGVNKCYLVPAHQSDWFSVNGMAEYGPKGISDETNVAVLRTRPAPSRKRCGC